MKRELDDDPALNVLKSKKPRVEYEGASVFQDISLRRYPSDLVEHGTDGTGYIVAKVRMVWEKSTLISARVDVDEECGAPAAFDLRFLKPPFTDFSLSCYDEFKLALRGCEVIKVAQSSGPRAVPIVLQYGTSALFKFSYRCKEEVLERDSLVQVGADEIKSENDWFGTPAPVDAPEPIDMPKSEILPKLPTSMHIHVVLPMQEHGPIPSIEISPLATRIEPFVRIAEARQPVENAPEIADQSQQRNQTAAPTKLSKRARKLKRAKERSKEGPPPTEIQKQETPPSAPQERDEVQTASSNHSSSGPSALEELNSALKDTHEYADSKETYVPIADALDPDFKRTHSFHFIGVVSQVGPVYPVSKTSQWKKFIRVVDASNKDDVVPEQEGFRVNCFVKESEALLPLPKIGDIIIFRNLMLSKWNGGVEATGPSDFFQWLVFSPPSGNFKHNGEEIDPRAVNVPIQLPGSPMPLWKPDDSQLGPLSAYCVKLADWWGRVQKERAAAASNATIHYLGEEDAPSASQRYKPSYPQRQHRLVKDCTPDMEPRGYFNCTLEILRIKESYVATTIIATDYTRAQNPVNYDLEWCPLKLRPYLLSMDIWNEGVKKAKDMRVGDFYRFNNARMDKSNKFKYWQASIREPKFERLKDTDELKDREFQDFLKRKAEWDKNFSDNARHELLSSIRKSGVITCTVQLLHRQRLETSTELFVTDFTASDVLAPPPAATWASRLEQKVLKVYCRGGVENQAEGVGIGSFCLLKNVIIRQSNATGQLYGELRGDEKLISAADKNEEHSMSLLGRKSEWLKSREAVPKGATKLPQRTTSTNDNCVPIKTILAEKAINLHQTVANVISYYPFNLEDAVTTCCQQCSKKLPANLKACPECQEDSYIEHYFYFIIEIEDIEGSRLKVVIGNASNATHPLYNVKPCNLWDNHESFVLFKDRILPLVGNIPEARAQKMAFDKVLTPPVKFSIDCRPNREKAGEMLYALRRYEEL